MGIEYRFRPIVTWPGVLTARQNRRFGQFSTSHNRKMALLDREVAGLGAREMVIQLALREGDLRIDGRPRAGANPDHPGCIVSFTGKYGSLMLPCDHFVDWPDNAYAVALHLEHLRQAGLYGVGRSGEQYRGWKALPGGAGQSGGQAMTVEAAARFVLDKRGAGTSPPIGVNEVMQHADTFRLCYRDAALVVHPDRGGAAEDWSRLQEAKSVLVGHHQGRGGR